MIKLYQDTKVSVAGISYTIPKSLYIVVDEFGDIKNNGLVFTTEENNCYIDIFTVESDASFNIRDDFNFNICENETYTVHGQVEERITDYMYSIRAVFESERHSYFEMHIGQINGYNERVEMLITVDKKKSDISEILRKEDVKLLIDSFEVTE